MPGDRREHTVCRHVYRHIDMCIDMCIGAYQVIAASLADLAPAYARTHARTHARTPCTHARMHARHVRRYTVGDVLDVHAAGAHSNEPGAADGAPVGAGRRPEPSDVPCGGEVTTVH